MSKLEQQQRAEIIEGLREKIEVLRKNRDEIPSESYGLTEHDVEQSRSDFSGAVLLLADSFGSSNLLSKYHGQVMNSWNLRSLKFEDQSDKTLQLLSARCL